MKKIAKTKNISVDENFVPDDDNFVRKFWRKKSNRYILLGSVVCIVMVIVLAVVLTIPKDEKGEKQFDTTQLPVSDPTSTLEELNTSTKSEEVSEIPTSLPSSSSTQSELPDDTTMSIETTKSTESPPTTTTTTEKPQIPIKMVTREKWGAKDPTFRTELKSPVRTIIIGDIPKDSNCTTEVN